MRRARSAPEEAANANVERKDQVPNCKAWAPRTYRFRCKPIKLAGLTVTNLQNTKVRKRRLHPDTHIEPFAT
jgi:hypothetical protein